LGGTWGSYTGDTGIIDAESPVDFIEFDYLLEKVCPQITFLQYKNIMNKCISIEEECDRDYYGGCSTRAYYKCNIPMLYNLLIERGLFDNTKL
jgi:hypothetical protein